MTLLDFVRTTAEHWARGGTASLAYNHTVVALRDQLDRLWERYQSPPPAGGEEVQDLMIDAIELFGRALDCLEQFCERANPNLLHLAVDSAQEGQDVLESVQYVIAQVQSV